MRANSFLSKFTASKPLDSTMARIVDSIREVFRTILSKEILDGQLVVANLVVGSNLLQHKLQREYQGWIVVRKTNGSIIYEETSPDVTNYLKLNSSIIGEVTLWVF